MNEWTKKKCSLNTEQKSNRTKMIIKYWIHYYVCTYMRIIQRVKKIVTLTYKQNRNKIYNLLVSFQLMFNTFWIQIKILFKLLYFFSFVMYSSNILQIGVPLNRFYYFYYRKAVLEFVEIVWYEIEILQLTRNCKMK